MEAQTDPFADDAEDPFLQDGDIPGFTPEYYKNDPNYHQQPYADDGDDDDHDDGDGSNDNDNDSSDDSDFSDSTEVDQDGNPASKDSKTLTSEERIEMQQGGVLKQTKIAIFICLVLAAFVSALATTFVTRRDEGDDFEESVEGFGQEIATQSTVNLERAFGAARSLARTLSNHNDLYDGDVRKSFPYVTLPNFEIYGEEAREQAGADVMLYAPLVYASGVSTWQDYSRENQGWIRDGLLHEGDGTTDPGMVPEQLHTRSGTPHDHADDPGQAHQRFTHLPVWQMARAPRNASVVNLDLVADDALVEHDVIDVTIRRLPLLSSARNLQYLTQLSTPGDNGEYDSEWKTQAELVNETRFNPHARFAVPLQSYILQPVFDQVDAYNNDTGSAFIVGFVFAVLQWETLFSNILSKSVENMDVVVDDGCGRVFTVSVQGAEATFVGRGDLHDMSYDSYQLTVEDFGGLKAAEFHAVSEHHSVVNGTTYNDRYDGKQNGHCEYTLHIYPTSELESSYESNKALYPVTIVLIFAVVIVLLCVYDCTVIGRQRRLIEVAKRTNEIVASFFPKEVRKRMWEDAEKKENAIEYNEGGDADIWGEISRDEFEAAIKVDNAEGSPIADYFPSATLIFADLVGFTAWSSTRDPSQVFKLLESIFHAFDEIAKKRRVFKVETVGDCYVAATGLPERRNDHAVVMARFARQCKSKFSKIVKQLEVELGPDTSDLNVRIGIHSGPVTAGVLRGERARFQLFGDTVNTTARIETTGAPGKIHLSKDTAELLMAAGKKHWVTLRSDAVNAKGKGRLTTYWLETKRTRGTASSVPTSTDESDVNSQLLGNAHAHSDHGDDLDDDQDDEAGLEGGEFGEDTPSLSKKTQRLVQWNADLLVQSLKVIIARRQDDMTEASSLEEIRRLEELSLDASRGGHLVFDEVVEVVNLPPKPRQPVAETNPKAIELPSNVELQIQEFVRTISFMYHEGNPFHNFEHCSHVAMSTSKLLGRIIAPEEETGGYALRQGKIDENSVRSNKSNNTTSSAQQRRDEMHETTYGITSDPLIPFTAILAALVHDVDHPGVPNMTLVSEKRDIAARYHNKSVAEQNSIDLAWEVLMSEDYEDLRRALYTNKTEFLRFRQLLVNAVMATDIMDKQLGADRKARWKKTFAEDAEHTQTQEDQNRKATIVLEHCIQASDVAHTMQHYSVFLKWNERLFQEMYKAYIEGRAETDPSANWYKSEIGFFDFYIIPLAKKLESCGVFGVSSDEYRNYAEANREQWAENGEEEVKGYIERFNEKYGTA